MLSFDPVNFDYVLRHVIIQKYHQYHRNKAQNMVKQQKTKSVGVSVFARFRPCTTQKHIKNNTKYNFAILDGKTVQLQSKSKDLYHFDLSFKDNTTQQELFNHVGAPIVSDLMAGYNGTVFAYGQTGSGKTHSLFGDMAHSESDERGIIPRACAQIFDHIENAKDIDECIIKCSFIEIYLERLQDLLNPNGENLKIRQKKNKSIWIERVHEEYVSSFDDIYNLMQIGFRNRVVATTKMNKSSSRSHAVLMLKIKQTMVDGTIKLSKISFADLAGSEKVKKSGATGGTLEQAKAINLSLSALGNVIFALTATKKRHVPYRDSKLTHLLKDSLGGNTKTSLIVTCSSDEYNFSETVSTLKFATRAKKMKNTVSVNQQLSTKELQTLVEIYKKKLGEANETIAKLNAIVNKMRKSSNKFEFFGAEIDEILKEVRVSNGDDEHKEEDDDEVNEDVVEIVDNLKTRISAGDERIDALNETIRELRTSTFSQSEQIKTVQDEKAILVQRLSVLDPNEIALIVDDEEEEKVHDVDNEQKMSEYVQMIDGLKIENDQINNDREILLMWNEEMRAKLDNIAQNPKVKLWKQNTNKPQIEKTKLVKPIRKSVLNWDRRQIMYSQHDIFHEDESKDEEIRNLKELLKEMTEKCEKMKDAKECSQCKQKETAKMKEREEKQYAYKRLFKCVKLQMK